MDITSDIKNDFLKGNKGDKGDKGDTPQRGTDYWTEEDMNIIQSYIEQKVQEEIGTLNDELEARMAGGE